MSIQNIEKRIVGEKAAELIEDGMIIGLGTGSTIYYTLQRLGERIKLEKLNIRAVSTSLSTTKLAESLGVPLLSPNSVESIDLTIDGADEIDHEFQAIKGGGGALLFEKIAASMSKEVVVVVDSSKVVEKLGGYKLPIEVIPYGYNNVLKKLAANDFEPILRQNQGRFYKTDNLNYIMDIQIENCNHLQELSNWIISIPGVVEHGLFLNLIDKVFVGRGNEVIALPMNSIS